MSSGVATMEVAQAVVAGVRKRLAFSENDGKVGRARWRIRDAMFRSLVNKASCLWWEEARGVGMEVSGRGL
jgi:hypothetical protein